MAVMTEAEREQLTGSISPMLRLLISWLSKRHRRFEDAVFG
jgi:hypothetical protein